MSSEIARMREQIETECRALQNLSQFSRVSNHEAIRNRYERLNYIQKELAASVGEQQAIEISYDIYTRIIG